MMHRPSRGAKERYAQSVCDKLFRGSLYKYEMDDIVDLLNKISADVDAPDTNGIGWGDALISMMSLKNCLLKLGLGGTREQRNVKRAIIGSCIQLDIGQQGIINRKLMHKLLPHKDHHTRNDFINKSIILRQQLEQKDDAQGFCHDATEYTNHPEYPQELKDSIYQFGLDVSHPSPCPTDCLIKKDMNGLKIRNSDDSDWERVQLMFYCQTDEEMVNIWKQQNKTLYDSHYLFGDNISTITFKKYLPYFVKQQDIFTQFACDMCLRCGFLDDALRSVLGQRHSPNYNIIMGLKCTCDSCMKCPILNFEKYPLRELIDQLFCDHHESTARLLCASGKCCIPRCGVGKLRSVIKWVAN